MAGRSPSPGRARRAEAGTPGPSTLGKRPAPDTPAPRTPRTPRTPHGGSPSALQQHKQQLQLIQLEHSLGTVRTELELAHRTIQRLEADRSFLLEREAQATQTLATLTTTQEAQGMDLQARLHAATTRAIGQEEEAEGLRRELEEQRRTRHHAHEQLVLRVQAAEQATMAARKEASGYQQGMAALTAKHATALERITALERAALRQAGGASVGDGNAPADGDTAALALLHKQLQEQHRHIQTLEGSLTSVRRENAYLKQIQQSNEQLSQEIAGLQAQLAHHQSRLPVIAALEQECQVLKAEKQEWATFLQQHHAHLECATPYELAKALSEARLEVARLTLGGADVRAGGPRSAEVLAERQELKDTITRLAADKRALEQRCQEGTVAARKLELSKGLLHKEVAFLRELLASYEAEASSLHKAGTGSSGPGIVDLHAQLAQKEQQIAGLEGLVAEYRAAALQGNPTPSATSGPPPPPSPTNSSSELPALLAAKAIAEQRIEALQQRVEELTYRLALQQQSQSQQHQRSPELAPAQRILQLRDNPEAQVLAVRQQELDLLKQENAQLTAVLQRTTTMPPDGSATPHPALPSSAPVLPSSSLLIEMEALRQDLAQRDKRLSRLKDVFAAKVQEYRQAVYLLLGMDAATGYRVDIHPSSQIELTSAFASHTDARLLFSLPDPGADRAAGMHGLPPPGAIAAPSMSVLGVVEEGSALAQQLAAPRFEGAAATPALLAGLTLRLVGEGR